MDLFNRESRLAPFFWLHGEEQEALKQEIEAIYNCGIRSVCLESRTHEDFCRDKWFSDVRFIMEECKKRGMTVWILDDKHFPTGYANGVLADDKHIDKRAWGITETHVDVPGNAKDLALLADRHLFGDKELLAVIACRHVPDSELLTGESIDLTDNVQDGMLYFSLPEGIWRIFFIVKTRGGIGRNYLDYVDMLNPESVDLFIDEVYEKHYANIKDEFGKTFEGFFSDEPAFHNCTSTGHASKVEMGELLCHYPYSDKLLVNFKERMGKDALKLLPGLWAAFDDGREAKARYVYMDFITDEYRKNFCNRLADWCHKHKIRYIGHVIEDNRIDAATGFGCGHYFRALDGQDMSGIDVVLHQLIPGMKDCDNTGFVSYKHVNYNFFKYGLAKLGASMAHLDGKKNKDAMCEIFGAYGWAEGTKTMKWLCDHMLVRGINYFVPHAFSAKPDDTDCPPIFYFKGKNPEYEYFKKIAEYLERGAKLLSSGRHVADVALLYDAEFKWMSPDGVPMENVAKELYTKHIDYDIVPTDYLEKVSVTDGDIVIGDEKFKALIVPYARFIHEKAKKALEELKNSGAKIIFTDSLPENLDGEFTVKPLSALASYIKELGTDCDIDIAYEDIGKLHYVKDGHDIYMLTNEGIDETVTFTLRGDGIKDGCALYDALEDKLYKAVCKDNGVEITLPPYGSIFVISGLSSDETAIKTASEKELAASYRISLKAYDEASFAPYIETEKLFNITGKDEKPRFSGHMLYETEISCEGDEKVLDLGAVGETAKVTLNGVDLGAKIISPYSFDISSAVKKGENALKIEVTNTNVFALRDMFSQYLRIEPSGLLGPVKLKK